MENGIVLAVELAKIKLAYRWNAQNVIAAFENKNKRFNRTFSDALELLSPALGSGGLGLLKTFDRAGMTTKEMADAIWRAASDHYYNELKTEDESNE